MSENIKEKMSGSRSSYRVWDGEKKAYTHEGYVVTQLGLVGTYDPFVGLIRNINCTVEHCIGMKDKNGKPIYEKDIVRVHWTDQKPTEYIVRWNSVQCCFDFNEYRNNRRGCKFLKWQSLFTSGKSEVVEIIGNIHDDQFRKITKKVEV